MDGVIHSVNKLGLVCLKTNWQGAKIQRISGEKISVNKNRNLGLNDIPLQKILIDTTWTTNNIVFTNVYCNFLLLDILVI